jgi:DNA-binding protein HU-beta
LTTAADLGTKLKADCRVPLITVDKGSFLDKFFRKELEMNKTELVKSIATSAGLSQVAADKALKGFTTAVKNCLAKGDSVTLVGFGTFSVAKRNARTGRNPQTGKAIKIAAKKVAKFKAGSRLADAVN